MRLLFFFIIGNCQPHTSASFKLLLHYAAHNHKFLLYLKSLICQTWAHPLIDIPSRLKAYVWAPETSKITMKGDWPWLLGLPHLHSHTYGQHSLYCPHNCFFIFHVTTSIENLEYGLYNVCSAECFLEPSSSRNFLPLIFSTAVYWTPFSKYRDFIDHHAM